MTPTEYGALVTALLGVSSVAAALSWHPRSRPVAAPAAAALLAAGGAVAAWPAEVATSGRDGLALVTLLGGLLAVLGGGPVTASLFGLVDRREHAAASATIDRAGRVLRGGTWIGLLERAAVYATLVAGWPEGLAVTLAIKGLGRYPELRAAESGPDSGAAERFIIGTFASVLWAAACAAVVALVV